MPDNASSINERAGRGQTLVDAQEGLFDRIIDDPDLEAALEERESKRIVAADKKADYVAKADVASAKLNALGGVEPGEVVRCGRFRIKGWRRQGNSVAFETAPSNQIRITAIGE